MKPELDSPMIRVAQKDERAKVIDLTLSAYAEYADVMTPEAFAQYMGSIRHTLEHEDGAENLIAVMGDQIVASVLLYPAGQQIYSYLPRPAQYPEVRLLAVAPSARRTGVGKGLMQECIRRARLDGHDALGLHTSQMMTAAQKMYEKMGFERYPEDDFYPAPGLCVMAYLLHFGRA